MLDHVLAYFFEGFCLTCYSCVCLLKLKTVPSFLTTTYLGFTGKLVPPKLQDKADPWFLHGTCLYYVILMGT